MKDLFAKSFILSLLLVLSTALLLPVTAVSSPRIEVQALFRDKAMVNINGSPVMLKVGDEAVNGVRLIKSSSKVAVIEVNGEQKRYGLGSQVSTRLTEPESTVVRIPSQRGMFVAHGLINGRIVKFLVDTGASAVTMARPTADRLQILYRQKGTPVDVSTAAQMSKAWRVKLNSVSVGGIKLEQVDGIVIDTDHDQEILLGLSFLNRLKFSQEQGVVVLEARTR